jgi:hypothetical protein
MMTSGGIPISGPIAARILKRVKGPRKAAKRVATVLSRIVDPMEMSAILKTVEFAKSWADTDPTSWGDVYGSVSETGRRKRGIVHQVVGNAEYGARWAGDLYDVSRRNRSESGRAGKFKITENSPNTARITVGPDQRERRKKYVWERVGVQRQIAAVGLAATLVGGAKLHQVLTKAGEGSALVGIKNIAKRAAYGVRSGVSKAVGGGSISEPVLEHGPQHVAAQMAADLASQKEKKSQSAAKSIATKLTRYGEGSKKVLPFKTATGDVVPSGHPEAVEPHLTPDPKTGELKHRKKTFRKEAFDFPGGNPIPFRKSN